MWVQSVGRTDASTWGCAAQGTSQDESQGELRPRPGRAARRQLWRSPCRKPTDDTAGAGPSRGGQQARRRAQGWEWRGAGSPAAVEAPTGRGPGHVWPGLRHPAKGLGRASCFCSQRCRAHCSACQARPGEPSCEQGSQGRPRCAQSWAQLWLPESHQAPQLAPLRKAGKASEGWR